jgi:hypothetical protein
MQQHIINQFHVSISDNPKIELEDRAREIRLYLKTLEPLNDGRNTNLLKIGISSGMLMLYNLIEGVVRETLESVILAMNKNSAIKYLHLQDNLQQYACYYAIEKIVQANKNKINNDVGQSAKALKQNKKDLENKIYEVVSELFNSMRDNSSMQLQSKYLEFAGSIDIALLIGISQTFCIDFTIEKLQNYATKISTTAQFPINIDVITECFKTIKSIRNDLAHGHESFTKSARIHTILKIQQYLYIVYHILDFFITSTQRSLKAQLFLNNSSISTRNSNV